MNAAEAQADKARARGNVVRLAVAQALAGGNASVVFATGSIIGAQLAPDMSLATVPLSVFVLGMAAGTLPTGYIARHYGRRASFQVGAGFGVLTGLLAAVATIIGSFWLFCLATLCSGLYASVVQSFRFAAADGVSEAARPRALSWVMAGGVFAGVIGPQLVTWTMGLWAPYLFAASYVAQAGVALLAMAVLSGVDLPRPQSVNLGNIRPLSVIARQPRFVVAVICGVVSYVLMNLVMTSAPLAMKMCGLPVTASNWAIQWHIVAMYGPSFFTGSLIARFGAPRIVIAGFALTICAALTGLSGITETHFDIVLFLLGLGWNFGFIGASAMVLQCHTPEERTRVQSFNDFLVFGATAMGSFSSGQILASHGWEAVNLVVFPPIAIACVALAVTAMMGRRQDVDITPSLRGTK